MKTLMILALAIATGASACTSRLVDFTTLSSKNIRLNMDKGARVHASDCGPFGIGTNIKTAVDRAIESGGNPQADMLIDGVVSMSSYLWVWQCYNVEGNLVETRNARPVAVQLDAGGRVIASHSRQFDRF